MEFSVQSTMIQLPDTAVHVRQDGPEDAPAVLLLHGFAGSLHSFDDVTALLSDRFRVVRLDLRGHGRTGGSTGLDAPDQADMIVGVLDALGIDRPAAAVGHSFGADIAIELAARDRAERLMAIGQAPDYQHTSTVLRLLLAGPPAVAALLHKPILSIPALARRQRIAFAPKFRPTPSQADQMAIAYAAMAPQMYRTISQVRAARFARQPLDHRIAEVGVPALSIHGSHDQMYDSAASADRYRAAGAETVIIDGVGHSPNVEAPDRVAALIGEFVTR